MRAISRSPAQRLPKTSMLGSSPLPSRASATNFRVGMRRRSGSPPGPDWDADHARRLAEIERAAAVRSRSLPSPEQVAERLRSHQGASCSSGSTNRTQHGDQHGGTEQPGLRWQDIVAALRHGDLEPARGSQILTDTFRYACCSEVHMFHNF